MPTETKTEEYEWEVQECRLQFRPELWCCFTFEQAYEKLKKDYPTWFVYKGGNHIALHRKEGQHLNPDGSDANPRLLLLVAKPEFQTY